MLDITGMATIISAACSVATLLRQRLQKEPSHFLTPADIVQSPDLSHVVSPPTSSISAADFAELTVALYNTYDTAELQAINNRLAECRQQFMQTIDGETRQQCICNVLHQVAVGNGGALPTTELNDTFQQLCH